MSRDELREALAQRLIGQYELAYGGWLVGHVRPWKQRSASDKIACLGMADECIRQMVWTHIAAKWANPETMSYEDAVDMEEREDGTLTLTLAPEDWKP